MDNQENQEKQESKRLPGFYIALCCCVIAVGTAGYFTRRASDDKDTADNTAVQERMPEATEMVSGLAREDAVSAEARSGNVEDERPSIYIAPTPEPEQAPVSAPQVIYEDMSGAGNDDTDEAAEAAALFTSPAFVLPASGEILDGFSETLTYNNALGDWRTHNGTDIAVDAGGSVCAAADGTVSRIASDAMGEYVVIDHDGGFSSKYCGLSSVEDIAEGDSVTEGDVIGIVAGAKAENASDSHVHFELYKDGEPVDPMKYTG